MEKEAQPNAWQPLSPGGVARFARAKLSRLLLVELAVASIVAMIVIWFCAVHFIPVITKATQHFSEQTRLGGGRLMGLESGFLANGKFLSVSANDEGMVETGTADLQVKLAADGFDLCSLLGCVSLLYPNVNADLERAVAESWIGAWEPVILAGAGLLTVGLLLASWTMLGLLYQWPARLMAYLADRELSAKGSRRLAIAAQLPAALFMAAAIVLYGLQMLDLVRFLIFYGLHFFIGWAYVFIAPFFLPRLPGAPSLKENPFASAQKS